MIALSDNPAVTNPRKTLTAAQKHALCAIQGFRHQRQGLSRVLIGPHSFKPSTVDGLRTLGLVRGDAPHLALTEAGVIAAARLRGTAHA